MKAAYSRDYEWARNKLIPYAEAYANAACGKKPGAKFSHDRYKWLVSWNRAYGREMTRLVAEAGLMDG